MGPWLVPGILFAYFVGVFLAVVSATQRAPRVRTASTGVLAAGWMLQAWAIALHGRAIGHFPLSNSSEYLLALSWLVLTLHLVVALRYKVAATGLVLPPIAGVLAIPALWLPSRAASVPYPGQSILFVLHTTVATAGIAALCVAFAMSLIYILQDRALKAKSAPAVLERLPSLETADRIGHLAVLAGFPLLSLGIATGGIWSLDSYGRIWIPGAKGVFPLLAWGVFAAVIYGRFVRGFRGRRSAYLTIAGFALGLLTVLGMTL